MSKIMVAVLSMGTGSNTIVCTDLTDLQDALSNITPDEGSTSFKDMSPGAVVTITFEEMEESAVDALAEFEGW